MEATEGEARAGEAALRTRCGTVAQPEYHYAGSILIELLLILLFIVPAIFYHFWRRSLEYWGCPSCGSPDIIRLDSPIAAKRLEEDAAQGGEVTGSRGTIGGVYRSPVV